jgi:7-cyano-7-deazaguanine synthase
MNKQKDHVVLSLSGGLDSSTLLLRCLKEYKSVTCISFFYGQKHSVELERAQSLVDYLNEQFIVDEESKTVEYPYHITYRQIKLDGLADLLVSGLVDNDSMEMKKGHYAHENALTSVVPNRNAIFASITYAVALSVAKRTGERCDIALGTHMGDFNNKTQSGIYPDCSEEFKSALEHAFKIGNWDSDKVNYWAPYNITDKTGVLEDGIKNCKLLGLDYREIYKRTNTSYSPIFVKDEEKTKLAGLTESTPGIGVWYSDIYSGSSIERCESFIKLGLEDPLQYCENDGTLVSWDYVKEKVEEICKEFNSK